MQRILDVEWFDINGSGRVRVMDRALPIGLRLARTARAVTHAFDRALAEAGGSAATWQVLVLVRSRQWGKQSQLAEAMGIAPATLTHHLAALEAQGLVRRWREPSNRREQRVELTAEGAGASPGCARSRGVTTSACARGSPRTRSRSWASSSTSSSPPRSSVPADDSPDPEGTDVTETAITAHEAEQVERANATGLARRSCSSTACGCCRAAGTAGRRCSRRPATRR